MPALTRSTLSASPLADLHLLAGELGIDGYRRLRKPELVDRILERQGGDAAPPAGEDAAEERPSRSRRTRRRRKDADDGEDAAAAAASDAAEAPEPEPEATSAVTEEHVEGPVTIQSGGAAMIAVDGGADVYLSAAQVRRCELVDGDVVGGPVRPPRRSERHPSLVRVETINGVAADEAVDGTPFDALPCTLPSGAFTLPAELAAVAEAAPFGRGSRVTVSGGQFTGKSELLRRIGAALAATDGVEVLLALAGARPEEVAAWADAGVEPHAAAPLPASPDARARAVEGTVDAARRLATRGQDVVVLIDTLDGLDRGVARRALGAARNLTAGGSLTVIATGAAPVGGETTVIGLERPADGSWPALDRAVSGVLRPDALRG